ncbi:mechanosensitive ion channel family protein [bacterium]|nr:mechanosensitive ion channel family protein [candidate division CSSED10-310 bacterium]
MLTHVLFGTVTVYDLLISILIIIGTGVLSRAFATYLRRTIKDRVSSDHLQIIIKSVYYGFIAIALMMILPMLGFKISGILVAGGFAGVVIGFASQNIVSNLMSGVILMIERPIKIGNAVAVDGLSGTVQDITIMSTIIRTWDGLYVRIPNIKVFTGTLTNYMAHVVRRFSYTIGIRYQDDAEQAIRIIRSIIETHPLTLVDPAPLVYVGDLAENAVTIHISIWVPTSEWFAVKNELLWQFKRRLEEGGIQIPFPQRVVWMETNRKEPASLRGQSGHDQPGDAQNGQ